MKNLEEVIISVTKGAEEVEAKYKWNGRRYVTSNGMTGKLVRCEDCKHWKEITNTFGQCESDDMWRSLDGETVEVSGINRNADDYCSYGEREGE